MMKLQNIFHAICLPLYLAASSLGQSVQFPDQIMIGGVLGTQEAIDLFYQCINDANQPGILPGNITVKGTAMLMDENPIRAARDICLKMIDQQVYVVLVSHPHPNAKSPLSVSYTCKFYNIPVIGVGGNLRDSIFSEKSVHATFLRTVSPISHQADLWLQLLKFYKWKKAVFITELTQEGRNILSRFQDQAKSKIELETTLMLKPGLNNYTEDLIKLERARARVVLMFVSQSMAEVVYKDAMHMNLTGPGFVWIVTEQALNVQNIPQGILGFQLRFGMNESLHIQDAMNVVVKAIQNMYNKVNLTEAPSQCVSNTEDSWDSGHIMFNALKEVDLPNGKTGKVKFDEVGDRDSPVYDLVNVQEGELVKVGTYGEKVEKKKLQVTGPVIWPGKQNTTPSGENIERHLKVVTIEEVPFVFSRTIQHGEHCKTTRTAKDGYREIYCPHINDTTGVRTDKCCRGYCIDLLFELGAKLNFTYDVHLVEDGRFGSYEKQNNRSSQEWNGMIGELLKKKADLVVGPLTITPDRSLAVKFSKPFKYQGLTVLMKRGHKDSKLDSFLQPFQPPLWILVLLSVHVVALVLYLLDRFSPFGHYKLAKSSDESEEHPLDLSTAIWFAWGVLLSSGIGEGTPRSFSARVVGMVWAGFAMIIIASYTANLAAFLVLDRPTTTVSGINDIRLRNPTDEFIFNTVKGSSVEEYFKRRVELSTMYRTMEGHPIQYHTPDEAIKAVIEGKELNAFIWESTRLEHEAAKRCDLVTAAEMFGKERLGIAVRHGNPYAEAINLQVLGFHEEGYMEKLDGEWILKSDKKCNEVNSSPATLGLTNMAGVFMLVAGGILSGIFIVFVEITYHRHVSARQKEMELARHAAARWRGNIEKRKTLRASWAVLRKDKADHLDKKRRMQRNNQLEHEQLEQLHNGADGKLVNGRGVPHAAKGGAAQAEPGQQPTFSGEGWEDNDPEYRRVMVDHGKHGGQRVDIV